MTKDLYLAMIQDAYARMTTNRDDAYRAIQMKKVEEWLELATQEYERELQGA